MTAVTDSQFMARAIELAKKGLCSTHPNPRVGCVLVKDGQVVGEGFHRCAGEPHAERNALAEAGGKAKGATAFVTLEPCFHTGRTPPCSKALVDAGIARVVVAMEDPNPRVAGRGCQQLREAGIDVTLGVLEAAAHELNPGFIKRMEQGLPYVYCKLAMSLDGRTAMANGESQWITEQAARKDVQRLRARCDAIVTGIGTVLADNPSMNVRLGAADLDGLPSDDYRLQPLRVVLDRHLRMPADAKMLTLDGATLVATLPGNEALNPALLEAGAEVISVPGKDGGLDLEQIIRDLADREVNEILIEAGPTLAGSALAAGIIDELIIYAAPHIMGDGGRGLFHLPGMERMDQRIELQFKDVRMVGRDLRLTALPVSR